MKRRELIVRRAVPAVLALAVLVLVVLPLLTGIASAGKSVGRILGHG